MKELNTAEVNEVSGAGFIANIFSSIGGTIGGIVDSGAALGGLSTDAKSSATKLGAGIGKLFELNFMGAISDIGGGIAGIVGFGIDAISQLTKRKK